MVGDSSAAPIDQECRRLNDVDFSSLKGTVERYQLLRGGGSAMANVNNTAAIVR